MVGEVLFENDSPTLHSSLRASFTESGDLQLAGQDFGKFVEGIMSANEYEYWLTVEASHLIKLATEMSKELNKPMPKEEKLQAFILETLKILYASDQAFKFASSTDFQFWLDKRGIPSRVFSYS